jgi:hypothetical protein
MFQGQLQLLFARAVLMACILAQVHPFAQIVQQARITTQL